MYVSGIQRCVFPWNDDVVESGMALCGVDKERAETVGATILYGQLPLHGLRMCHMFGASRSMRGTSYPLEIGLRAGAIQIYQFRTLNLYRRLVPEQM